jgi:hypothetical protein
MASQATKPSRNGKPPKPNPGFPLFTHATGRFLATRLWRQSPTQPMAPTNTQIHGRHHSAPQCGGFLLALFAALSIGVATGCQDDADATTDYSEPMQVWTVHGIRVHDQMTPSQVSTAMGASLEEVVTIRSDDTLRGKGSMYIHSCKGHAFYFFKKDATNPDEPAQPKRLAAIAVGEGAGDRQLQPTGGWLHRE